MKAATKQRNPRNREWEKQRRNKFNDAISKLGDLVKAINKANNTSEEEDNAQYPKIEIIQKAIVCLTSCAQEKTQLRAEILALQVKLDNQNSKASDKRDASTQVYIALNKKKKKGKYVKALMLDKSQNNSNKQKKDKSDTKISQNPQKLPMLLPKTNFANKKGPENTIVVLPAAPFIFPQRPFLIPSVPPTIVVVDPNIQSVNKLSIPTVNRSNSDITKTTMVNILPISAYSRPLSATKNKKLGKIKNENKRVVKKSKTSEKTLKETIPVSSSNEVISKINTNTESENNPKITLTETERSSKKISTLQEETIKENNLKPVNNQTTESMGKEIGSNDLEAPSIKLSEVSYSTELSINKNSVNEKPISVSTSTTMPVINQSKSKIEDIKTSKDKEATSKEKSIKLPNILDPSLCDSAVDGGNARLELAEEFLAASPTAAFLMSFPLVSGNRADSPAEEQNVVQSNPKDVNQRRHELTTQGSYFEKSVSNSIKEKPTTKIDNTQNQNKHNEQQKCASSIISKHTGPKASITTSTTVTSENPFLSLTMPSLVSTSCTGDSTFGLDFDCNMTKPVPSQPTNFVTTSSLFYKNDPFSTAKSAIYSTSSISSNHDFNSLGLYPCAMEKYTSKNKSDYSNMEDSLMKIGSSRLTYDIDLGWSHKSFDFVNCTTTASTFTKESILPTSSISYSSYNPFNPEFHVPLVSSSTKKDNTSKPTSSVPETITSFYSQPTNLWPEDVPFYSSSNISKTSTNKQQSFLPFDHGNPSIHVKPNISKHYDIKDTQETVLNNSVKSTNINSVQTITEKYTKKSPNKMHINWMTSEIRSMPTNCNSAHPEIKESHKHSYSNINHKSSYTHLENNSKKQDQSEGNYFPISMHTYPTQINQDEFQVWPTSRPLGTAEVSIEPPPVNLPTLVGDLALGPHDKKKNADLPSRAIPHSDSQNCGNFLSVTQLMNRTSDHITNRYQATSVEASKSFPTVSLKQNMTPYTNDHTRKGTSNLRMDSNITEPYYVFNDPKLVNSYENIPQFSHMKPKSNNKSEKGSKSQKNSYSAEALIRSGNCSQKIQDVSAKFMSSQKYNDCTPQESGVAQISHYPPILDYSDNVYVSQQFSSTALYNTTTNTISNSFYSNFMPGSSNLITSSYTTGPYAGDFIDYNNQNIECNYSNHKYEDLKIRNNSMVCQPEKATNNFKSSRRESASKHKLECSKKDSNKKFQSKRAKLTNEVEEWSDPNNLLWQNKSGKRHPNFVMEELSFPNYVGNQVPTQYQPDFFNNHLMPSNMQNMGHNMERSLPSFPGTSRTNFNLSTIFPEITMKVQ